MGNFRGKVLTKHIAYGKIRQGTTPITKNRANALKQGVTPIEKNVRIIDSNNVIYGATYPKRARGLVKKGRARFIDENTICMPRPAGITEDSDMSEIQKKQEATTAAEIKPETPVLSIEYLLAQIAKIADKTDYINGVISELRQIETGTAGDIAGQYKAAALSDVVKCRETTNQQLLRLYEKMYDDLKPDNTEKAIALTERTLNNSTLSLEEKSLLTDALQSIMQKS